VRVRWSAESLDDLAALRAFIASESPAGAVRIARRISEIVATTLSDNPEIGRQGRVPGTRELVVARTPFLVAYRVRADAIEVVRILHGAQRWPDRL
jgi:toxin ParE1/3/4